MYQNEESTIRINNRNHKTIGIRKKKRIRALMFADDLVLLANTPTEINRMLKTLEEWANEFSLEINTNKSELIVQRNQDKTPVKLYGEILPPKKGAKYLGYEIRRRTTSNAQMQARTEKTKQAINALMYTLRSAKGFSNCNKANMAKSIITQTATYALETSSSKQTKTILNTLERVQRKMARHILRASKTTAIETTLEDLGWLTSKE